jgi:DNA-binding CsgD family transcriptional regulator
MTKLSPARMSDLIGIVYDCAIEPSRWPKALEEICRSIECVSGIMLLVDLVHSQHRFAYTWGLGADWARRYFEHSNELTRFYSAAFSRDICTDGEPLLFSPVMERVGRIRYIYDEWTQPQGVSEMIQTVVLRQARRLAVFGANRHQSAGVITADQLEIIRLLVPHIRRAVTIIDILDAKNIEIATLAATLDTFKAGILVVADHARLLHANSAGRKMLAASGPIATVRGSLCVRDTQAHRELRNAIELARLDEATIGATGIGVPLRDDAATVAHVLPLARGELRTRLVPEAAAAVFFTKSADSPPEDIGAIATTFDLTPAETRVLEYLVSGATFADAAEALKISANTAKTHLARIFSKTGVSRQADLIALVNRLVPPIHRPKN